MANIEAGKLDRRITIQAATDSRDEANDVVKTWADAFPRWARVADQRGFETVGAQQLVRTADTVFTIRNTERARTIFPESHRIEYKGKIYEIISIQEGKARGDTLEILASSRPDGVGARGRGAVSGE